MRSVTTRYSFLFALMIIYSFNLYSVKVGSTSSCSKQARVVFEKKDSDNKMDGFAAFSDGFAFDSEATTCTFDSYFPVSGVTNFNGGTLYLSRDLKFDKGASLLNIGNVYGNSLSVEFCEDITTLLVGDSEVGSGSWEELDSVSLGDDVVSIDWSYDNGYIAAIRDSSKLRVYSFDAQLN